MCRESLTDGCQVLCKQKYTKEEIAQFAEKA